MWRQDADCPEAGEMDYLERATRLLNTYAFDGETGSIRLYVDGSLWLTYTQHVGSGPMHAVFQTDRLGSATGTPWSTSTTSSVSAANQTQRSQM
jgi:hypothetical protein